MGWIVSGRRVEPGTQCYIPRFSAENTAVFCCRSAVNTADLLQIRGKYCRSAVFAADLRYVTLRTRFDTARHQPSASLPESAQHPVSELLLPDAPEAGEQKNQ